MNYKSICTYLAFLFCFNLFGQITTATYESKMVDLGEIDMEYMDFGGDGNTIIWVQDFHNYFEGTYKDTTVINHFAAIAGQSRLLAPLRRGYGRTTNTEWGYDVATQAEDLIHFMNALGIEKAILLGRQPANQDMLWIAEHHPDRLSGLIFLGGDPILIVGCENEDERFLMENWCAFAPDFEKEKEKRVVMSRAYWRPHILTDTKMRIPIPTLRLIYANFSNSSVISRLANKEVLQETIYEESEGFEMERQNLKELVEDSARFVTLQIHLKECDPSTDIATAMERAFAKNLKTVKRAIDFSTRKGFEEFLRWEEEEVKKFLKNGKK